MLNQIITHFAHGPKDAPVQPAIHSKSLGEKSQSNGSSILTNQPNRREIVEEPRPSNGKNCLTVDVEITGSLRFSEELILDGKIEGDLLSEGHLVVGENARVKGDIVTRSVVVYGNVEGNIKVREHCQLMNGSVFNGELTSATIAVEEGAAFSGHFHAGKCAAAEAARLASESALAELAHAKTAKAEPSHLSLANSEPVFRMPAFMDPAPTKPAQMEPVFSEQFTAESPHEMGLLLEA